MENENTIIKSKWNKDLLYSFVFVVLAWVTLWYGGSISGIFDPILNLPFMAKPYVGLLHVLSRIGFNADPMLFLFASGLPFLFSIVAIYLAVRWGVRTSVGEGKRKLFGFVPRDRRGIFPVLLIILAVLNMLLLWHVFAAVSLFEPSIFPELN